MTLGQRVRKSLCNAVALSLGFLFGWWVLLPLCMKTGIVGIILVAR